MRTLVFATVWAMLSAAGPVVADWPTDPTINLPLCTAELGQWTSRDSAVADGAGGAIVVWVDPRNGGSDIYAQRIDADGETVWIEDGVAMCDAAGSQDSVQTVTDGSGGAIVVWLDDRGSGHGYYAQRVNPAGEILWPTGAPSGDGVPLADLAERDEHLAVVADGAGGVIAAWRNDAAGNDGIHAQRLSPAGEFMWPGGAPSAAGVTVCETDGAQTSPAIDTDGAGSAVIVWTDGRDSATTRSDIYAQRLNSDGSTAWTLDGVPLCRADYGQVHPVIASDGSGGAIVAWEDYRITSSAQGIYAQRVSSAGTTMWAPQDGIVLCDTFSGDEGSLQVLTDGAGGAYLVWRDVRNAAVSGSDIYAQRMSGAGSELWGAGDVVVSAAPDKQQTFDAVSHSAGGVIVSWTDFRPDTFTDIYAQHLDPSGTPSGPVDGAPVSTAFSSQYAPSIASDGAGGAIIAWFDYRDSAVSGSDVYVQNAFALESLFEDGFESGGTSAWSAVFP